MQEQTRVAVGSDRSGRSAFLAEGRMAAWAGGSCRAGEPDSSQSQEDQERREVEAIAAKARLRVFATTRSAHYLGIGDLRCLAIADVARLRGGGCGLSGSVPVPRIQGRDAGRHD